MQPFWNNQACERNSLANSSLILKLGFTIFITNSVFGGWQGREA
jgi:hypothetical protein